MTEFFTMTEDHIKLLKRMYVRWDDDAYDGAPTVDIKRPYGNSNVWGDVAEIIGICPEEDDDGEKHFPRGTRERCLKLHREAEFALQIVMQFQSFEPGDFKRDMPWHRWERVLRGDAP